MPGLGHAGLGSTRLSRCCFGVGQAPRPVRCSDIVHAHHVGDEIRGAAEHGRSGKDACAEAEVRRTRHLGSACRGSILNFSEEDEQLDEYEHEVEDEYETAMEEKSAEPIKFHPRICNTISTPMLYNV